MKPFSIVFDLQRLLATILALILWTAAAFASGYMYKWHRVSVESAEQAGKQEVVTTATTSAVAATDTQAVDRLTAALATTSARAASLEKRLKDQSHATPAPVACRLDDGMREQINADLATGAR